MKCSEAERLASMAVDGELDRASHERLERHLLECGACRVTQQRYERIGKELETMPLSVEHDRSLDAFEGHVYARLERGVAWILLSLGAVLLAGSGAFYLVRDFLLDPSVGLPLRGGVAAAVFGLIVLLVGVIRHRLATYRTDPYKGVER